MGRRKGPDVNKVTKITEVLKRNPQGLWIREIARQAKLTKSTTHRYVTEYMKNQVEGVLEIKGLVKFVRLKRK